MERRDPGEYISWQTHHGLRVGTSGKYDVIACERCGFRHVVPLPSEEEAVAAYASDYYSREKPNYLDEAREDQRWSELMYTDRLSLFESLLGNNRRRLLDIGSGPGLFLQSAAARGWQALGIEPSHQAAEFSRSRGANIIEAPFCAETIAGLGQFDVIHMNNVLEHIADPVALLELTRDCLAEGGVECINVPNDFTPMQSAARTAAGTGPWWIAPPHHLNYFDFPSLSALLERLGFTIRMRTTSFPMEMFLLMGDNYVGNGELGRACHKKRMRFDLNLEAAGAGETRRMFYQALAEAGIGREVVLIASKA